VEKNRTNLLKWFRSLTDNELVEVFYESIANRRTTNEETGVFESRLALTLISREKANDGWGAWSVQLLCPAPGFAAGSPMCQDGEHCGFATLSCAKHSQCPICGGEVYGT
jgi:hypothetical protein